MGGVSRPSQIYAEKLFSRDRTDLAVRAVPDYYDSQRERYAKGLESLNIELFSGDGGFYHWCRLPGTLNAQQFNEALFKHGAAILKGTDCDMRRMGDESTLNQFFRFSFGPLEKDSFESDIKIMENVLSNL